MRGHGDISDSFSHGGETLKQTQKKNKFHQLYSPRLVCITIILAWGVEHPHGALWETLEKFGNDVRHCKSVISIVKS